MINKNNNSINNFKFFNNLKLIATLFFNTFKFIIFGCFLSFLCPSLLFITEVLKEVIKEFKNLVLMSFNSILSYSIKIVQWFFFLKQKNKQDKFSFIIILIRICSVLISNNKFLLNNIRNNDIRFLENERLSNLQLVKYKEEIVSIDDNDKLNLSFISDEKWENVKIKLNNFVNSMYDKEYFNFKMSQKLVNSGVDNIVEASKIAVTKIVPNLGAGGAAGAVGAATIKATTGMPLAQRALTVGTTTLVSAVTTKIGLELGDILTKNDNIEELIKSSPHANVDPDRIPSPDIINSPLEFDIVNTLQDLLLSPFIINSPLEYDKFTPLQELLLYSFILDIFILLLLLSLLIIIFNRYILSFNLNFVNSVLNKYIPIKIRDWYNKYLNIGIDYSSKFVLVIFVVNTISLIIIVLLKIFISSELLININSYINVHNFINSTTKNSSILFMVQNSGLDEMYKGSKHADPDIDRIPSPDNSDFINSFLDDNEIPLIVIVNGLHYLNIIEMSLLFTLFSLYFRKFINKYLKNFISYLLKSLTNNNIKKTDISTDLLKNNNINEGIKTKGVYEFEPKNNHSSINNNYNDKFIEVNKGFKYIENINDFIILFVFICLFWIKIMNIYFSGNLANNVEAYVNVYNHIKNDSNSSVGLIILLSLTKYNYRDYVITRNSTKLINSRYYYSNYPLSYYNQSKIKYNNINYKYYSTSISPNNSSVIDISNTKLDQKSQIDSNIIDIVDNANTITPIESVKNEINDNKYKTKIKQINLKILFQIKKVFSIQNYKSAFLLPFILNSIGSDMNKNPEPIVTYAFSMITLSLIVLFCFINVFGYILSLYLISKYDVEVKYPKLKKYIYYFNKSRKIIIVSEAITGFIFLIFILLLNILLFTSMSLIK